MCLVVFANATVDREQVGVLVPIMGMFKASTTELMRGQRIFTAIQPASSASTNH
ncbi:MAG: hypothetical protein H0V44_17905 [Planctomycetes bacterium]|nr:hypothetical protein [Planctomycetota bacterium]